MRESDIQSVGIMIDTSRFQHHYHSHFNFKCLGFIDLNNPYV